MTLQELLDIVGIQVYHFSKIHDETLQYHLNIEYKKRSPFPDEEEYEIEKNVTKIDIDNNNKTITLKGENK